MRTYLMTGAAVLLLAAPALGQTVTQQTTTTREYVTPAPLLVAPPEPIELAPPPVAVAPPVMPMPGTSYQSTTTQYGASGMGYSETTNRYVGTDGILHTDRVIHDNR